MHKGVENIGAEGGGIDIVGGRPLVPRVSVHRGETEDEPPRLPEMDGFALIVPRWTFLLGWEEKRRASERSDAIERREDIAKHCRTYRVPLRVRKG